MNDGAGLDKFQTILKAGRVFTPTSPVDEKTLFSGRREQLRRVIDAVHQKGQHVVIYGERGVGKTSLANVLAAFIPALGPRQMITPRVNCDSTDSYQSVFEKALREIDLVTMSRGVGFTATLKSNAASALDFLNGPCTPDNIRRALTMLSQHFMIVIILDEFDRLPDAVKHGIADTIKSLSDHGVDATIIAVGVADTVNELIREHASIERALVQVHMPRMSNAEISEIINNGARMLGLSATSGALASICTLSQGLPHYAHQLGLSAARLTIEHDGSRIDDGAVSRAIDDAVNNCQQSISLLYHTATMSPRKDNLFKDVLLACALAQVDQMGYFAAQDVREPMQMITGKSYDIPSFSQHLTEFCDEKRGPILIRIGTPRRYRFRFINPLLQPHVVMLGCKQGKIRLG